LARRTRPRGSNPATPTTPAPAPSAVTERLRPWLPVACVLALLGILFPEAMFQAQVFGAADTAASEAFRQVGDASRRQGDYPLWNPFIFGGMPTFGSLAYTLGVYPPTVVLEWLQGLGLPPLTWLLAHLLFGGLGMWWLLGRWRAPAGARLVSVVLWLWFACVVAWSVHGHGSKAGAAMYLPWLVGFAWSILTSGSLRATAFAGLLLGLQFLRGHPQISYYTLLLLGFLTVWHLAWPLGDDPRPPFACRARRGVLVAVAIAIGFAIGAALLLPVHDYAAISTRGEGGASGGGRTAYDYATDWSLGPEDLAAGVLPAAAGFGRATYLGRMPFNDYPNYFGPLVLALAAAAWLTGRRRLVLGLGAGALLSVLLAMGRFSPGIYQLCYHALPYFDKFRVPSMIMIVAALVVAILAGLGAGALADDRGERSRLLRRAAIGLLAAGGLCLVAGAAELAAGGYRGALAALAAKSGKQGAPAILDAAWTLHRSFLVRGGLVLMAAGGAALLASRRPDFRRRGLLPVLAALVAIDLGGVAHLVAHPEAGLVEVVRGPDGAGRLAPSAPLARPWQGPAPRQVPADLAGALQSAVGSGRLLPLGGDAASNAYMTVGVRSLGGYHPAKPAAAEAVRTRLFGGMPAGRIARWLAATAVTYPDRLPPEALDLLRQNGLDLDPAGVAAGGTMVYTLRDPLPRARLVDSWRPAPPSPGGDALASFLDDVQDGRHEPGSQVVLEREPRPQPQAGPQPLPTPEFVRDDLNEVVLRVDCPRPALLLLADLWAPGWRVAVDGEPAPLLRADLILRAVALDAGVHEIRFAYRDRALTRGLALTAIGMLGVLILLVVSWRRNGAAVAVVREEGEDSRHEDVH